MHTVILGAGISGLAAAYETSRLRGDYSLYEQDSIVGGLCRMQRIEDFSFDIVSHVLHFRSDEAKRLVHEALDGNLIRSERRARIYFRGRYVPYPFQTHMAFLPLAEKVSCLTGYCRARINRKLNGIREAENFEEWIYQNFGSGIARHFMSPYNLALWGIPLKEMSSDWVQSFVPRGSFREAVASFFFKQSKHVGYNAHFYYPAQGGMQALVDALGAHNPRVYLNKRATEVNLERKTVRFEDGEAVSYDHLISTIPLKTLALNSQGMPPELVEAAGKLRCTTLLNVTCCLRRPLPHSYHWVYFPEAQFPFFRLVFPSNVCPTLAPPACSIISAEISNPDRTQEARIQRQVEDLLLSLGLVDRPSDIVLTSCKYVDHAYPVHDLGRQARVESLRDFLRSKSVWSIGRFGGWHYSSIDDAIVEALQTAREVSGHQPDTVSPSAQPFRQCRS